MRHNHYARKPKPRITFRNTLWVLEYRAPDGRPVSERFMSWPTAIAYLTNRYNSGGVYDSGAVPR